MKFSEYNFRELYNHYSVVKLNDALRYLGMDLPYISESDCLLLYGYIDHDAGISFKVMTSGKKIGDDYHFFPIQEDTKLRIHLGAIENEEAEIVEDIDVPSMPMDEDEDLFNTRQIKSIDTLRHPYYPDDIQVIFHIEGFESKLLWVKLQYVKDGYLGAILDEEPENDIGLHVGDEIRICIKELSNGEVICFYDNDLEDNFMQDDISCLIQRFYSLPTKDNLIKILASLRGRTVWVPYNNETQYCEILNMNGRTFLPIHTYYIEAYGPCIKMSIEDAIKMFRRSDVPLEGLLVNALSDSFYIDLQMMAYIEAGPLYFVH